MIANKVDKLRFSREALRTPGVKILKKESPPLPQAGADNWSTQEGDKFMPTMKDGGRICTRFRWRKEPILVTVMIITLSFLLATMALLITAVDSSEPLFLSPLLDNNETKKARELSFIEADDIPASHSGYITVNKTLGNHLFFWFFPLPPSKDNNKSAPLLLWLNGGPGISAMLGLFWENGPLEIVSGSGEDEPTIKHRSLTWAENYSIVYVDNPVGVGFSYSDHGIEGYRTTQDGYGSDLHSFVKQFFKMFPEYRSRDFYVGGQSYAGRYIPSLAIRIHEDLKRGTLDVPLTGIYLGAPYFDCHNQMNHFFEYLYSVGAISYGDMNRYQARAENLYASFQAGNTKNMSLNKIFRILVPPEIGLKNVDNYVTGEEPDHISISKFLTSPRLRRLLKVGERNYKCVSSRDFFGMYGEDIFQPTTDKLAVLLDNYKVLIYTGDYDVIVNSRMVDEALMLTPWSGREQFSKVCRSHWQDENKMVQGFYSKTGSFCRVVIHGAGHQVPHDQPEAALRMIGDFINYGCIHGNKEKSC